jgi:hypothetical protein
MYDHTKFSKRERLGVHMDSFEGPIDGEQALVLLASHADQESVILIVSQHGEVTSPSPYDCVDML